MKDSEVKPTYFEDSLYIKGKLAGRIVSWGGLSDTNKQLRQKHLGLLMGNLQADSRFHEIFPYGRCGNKEARALSGKEIYNLNGNLKLVIIEDTVDAKKCPELGNYIIWYEEEKGTGGYYYRLERAKNYFSNARALFDDSVVFGEIISKHESLFSDN
ncbi:hypothetical protein [Leptospira idonii]|nr:hypothetical protein [Leptospira idonii]